MTRSSEPFDQQPTLHDDIIQACMEFSRRWTDSDADARPDLESFPPKHDQTLPAIAALGRIDLRNRILAGEQARVEEYLERFPVLKDSDECWSLIEGEFNARQESDPPELSTFVKRFPEHEERLINLFEAATESHNSFLDTTLQHDGNKKPAEKTSKLPKIADYEIIDVIAAGGMGKVYKGRDTRLDRLAAVKVPHPQLSSDPESLARFLREARSAASLRHPNICAIYRVADADARPFIAMEYIEGTTLKDLADTGELSPRESLQLVSKVAEAVEFAHQRQIVHRDIKPGNILIDGETGEPILTDFGLAKQLDDLDVAMTQTGQIMGTPAYMAPEQASGEQDKIGPPVDTYAVGAVLYHLLCGRPPFVGGLSEILASLASEEPVPPRKRLPSIHRDIDTICMKALAKSPLDRYESCQALADDIDRFLAGEAIVAKPEGVLRKSTRWLKRRAALATSLTIAAAVLILGLWLWKVGSESQRSATQQRAINTLSTDIDASFDRVDWTPEKVAEVEAKIDELETLQTDEAKTRRTRLVQSVNRAIYSTLANPRLATEDGTTLSELSAWLAVQDKALGDAAEAAIQSRLADWNHVVAETAAQTSESTVPQLVAFNAPTFSRFNATFNDLRANQTVGLVLNHTGHSTRIDRLEISPDQSMLASHAEGDNIALWDLKKWKLNGWIDCADANPQLSFFGNDLLLVQAPAMKELSIWNISKSPFEKLKTLAANDFACEKNRLAVVNDSGIQVYTQGLEANSIDDTTKYLHCAISADSRVLSTINDNGEVAKWSLLGEEYSQNEVPTSMPDPTTLSLSGNGKFLAIANDARVLELWDLEEKKVIKKETFVALPWTPRFLSEPVALVIYDGDFGHLWRIAGDEVKVNRTDRHITGCPPVIDDGLYALDNSNLQIWTTKGLKDDSEWRPHYEFRFLESDASCLAIAGQEYVRGGNNGRIEIRNTQTNFEDSATIDIGGERGYRCEILVGPTREGAICRLLSGTLELARTTISAQQLGSDAITLEILRLGRQITVSLNNEEVMSYEELLAAGTEENSMAAVFSSPGVTVSDIDGFVRRAASDPSGLERGDLLFQNGDFEQAKEFYSEFSLNRRDEFAQEARYKRAMCLFELSESDQAIETLQTLQAEEGDHWPVLALFQEWLQLSSTITPKWRRHKDASAQDMANEARVKVLFDVMRADPRFEQDGKISFLRHVPLQNRVNILEPFYSPLQGYTHVFAHRPNLIEDYERANEIAKLLQVEDGGRQQFQYAIACQLKRNRKLALQVLRDLVNKHPQAEYIEALSALQRQDGHLEIKLINDHLLDDEQKTRPLFITLLLERARIYKAEENWEAAQQDLDEFLANDHAPVKRIPEAYLMKGAILEHQEKIDEATECYRESVKAYFRSDNVPKLGDNWELREQFYLIALSWAGDFTPEEANRLIGNLFDRIGNWDLGSLFSKKIGAQKALIAANMRIYPRSSMGEETCAKIVWGELRMADRVRTPFVEIGSLAAVQAAWSQEATDAEIALIIALINEAFDLYVECPEPQPVLNTGHLISGAFAWTGFIGVPGWAAFETQMSDRPEFLAKIAYLLARRYQTIGKPDDAMKLFRRCRELAKEPALIEMVDAVLAEA